MILLIIGKSQLKLLGEVFMSVFSDKMAELIAVIKAGQHDDTEVKEALEGVKAELAANTASDEEVKAQVVALAEVIANLPPAPPAPTPEPAPENPPA